MKKIKLKHLPKLKQDIIHSFLRSTTKKYDGLVEKIIQRKLKEGKKKNENTKV
jgi:hypothetical protein